MSTTANQASVASLAAATPMRKETSLGVPLRNLLLTLALAVSSLAIVGALWGETGYEMLIVAMGWPHVILGFLFYFGKVLRGEQGAQGSFLILFALTILFWTLHYFFALTALIYLYFLYHAFRDEIAIYLNTNAGDKRIELFALSGIAPLILLMLVIPQPPDFRHDLRRVELTGADLMPPASSAHGWTLIPFKAIPNSRGHEFYFTLQAPDTERLRAYTTLAARANVRADGEIRIADEPWPQAADLLFAPYYSDQISRGDAPALSAATDEAQPVLLTGGHRVGQTFRAERDGLAGIWLPINRFEDDGSATRFVFRLASPPLLPLTPLAAKTRIALIAILTLLVLWRLLPQLRQHKRLWMYLAVFVTLFAGLQAGLKISARAGFVVPMIFQFVVVFHYWSWYVFSINKLRAHRQTTFSAPPHASLYDLFLASLRRMPRFALTVIALNALSAGAAFWYYRMSDAPASSRYFLDYNYFLYFLVFHVTFSFAPYGWWQRVRARIG